MMTPGRQIEIRVIERLSASGRSASRLYVFCTILLCSLLLCGSILFAGAKLTFAVAVIPFVLPLMVAYAAVNERGIWDSTVLFPAAFAAYNGILLIRFLSQDARDHVPYPVKFSSHDFFMAGLLCALAAIFIALVWVIWKPYRLKPVSLASAPRWFNTGIIFYGIGVILYFLQYSQVGGYWSALGIERVERFEMMTETVSLPYIGFVLTGLAMMFVSRDSKRQRLVANSSLAAWCLLVLAQGDRRLVLQAILAVICAASFISLKRARTRLRYALLALLGYAAFSALGQLRLVIPLVVSGTVPLHSAFDSAGGSFLLETIKPENTEFAGPFLSVLYDVENGRHHNWGASYAQAIPAALPRVLYPGNKPLSLATKLANEVHKGTGPVSGWGYSPIAEAFLNFGIVGVCLISSAWMGLFIVLSRVRVNRWGLITAAVLSSECINANRIDFRNVYIESFYCLLAILLAAFVVKVLYPQVHKIPYKPALEWAR